MLIIYLTSPHVGVYCFSCICDPSSFGEYVFFVIIVWFTVTQWDLIFTFAVPHCKLEEKVEWLIIYFCFLVLKCTHCPMQLRRQNTTWIHSWGTRKQEQRGRTWKGHVAFSCGADTCPDACRTLYLCFSAWTGKKYIYTMLIEQKFHFIHKYNTCFVFHLRKNVTQLSGKCDAVRARLELYVTLKISWTLKMIFARWW